jgi:hypothetical protein
MTPVALRFLRRASVWAVVLAALIILVPRALTEMGLLGPSPSEEVAAAQRVVDAARVYGADEGEVNLKAASAALERARRLAESGERRATRRAAAEARARGVDAQRVALALREERRRRARSIVDAVDARLNDLEDAYAQASAGKSKQALEELLSVMKTARQSGASLFLSYEQGDFARVIEGEGAATESLEQARALLEGQRKKR